MYHCISTSYLCLHFLICGNPSSSTLRGSHQLDHHVVFGNRGITPSRSPNHLEDSVPTSCLARPQCSWPPHPTGNCGNDVLTMCRESNWWILESGELNPVKRKSSLAENYSTVNRTFNDTRNRTWNDAWNSNSILKKSSSKPSCPCVSIRAGCVFVLSIISLGLQLQIIQQQQEGVNTRSSSTSNPQPIQNSFPFFYDFGKSLLWRLPRETQDSSLNTRAISGRNSDMFVCSSYLFT